MKYIITEEQSEKYVEMVLRDIEKKLSPLRGWEDVKKDLKYHQETNRDIKYYQYDIPNKTETFIYITDLDYDGDQDFMTYYHEGSFVCDSLECPVMLFEEKQYNFFNNKYGKGWMPIFISWWEYNTGFPLKTIDGPEI